MSTSGRPATSDVPRGQTSTPAPLHDPAVVDRLGADLRAAGYTSDGVAEVLGDDANSALGRGIWWPALRATRRASAYAERATMIRLFLLGADEAVADVAAAFPATGVDALLANDVVARTPDGGLRAVLDIRPHADDLHDYLVVSDQDAAMRSGPVAEDHVLGIGGASISLARAVIREPVASALDIGTGCGIQALHLDAHADHIVATDTNPRALALAATTARLNGMSWDLRRGSLFEPVAGERFDLIVSNPPFVVGAGAQDYIYRDSGQVGDALCAELIAQIPDHLTPGGTAQILANWIVRDGDDWRERVSSWIAGTGLDAWVVQRELADPIDYISLWLSDAGEDPAAVGARGADWLDWFDAERIIGIGMGTITLRAPRPGRTGRPDVVIEEITGAGEELSGAEVRAFLARRDFLRDTADADLLGTRLFTAPVLLDTHAIPGDDGWQEIGAAVRRPGGPGATLGVDEVSRALLAGCRGQVPLGALIELLAGFHGVEPDALAAAAMPVVRDAIGRGILYVAP
ncbi:methyltransferase [Gordonia sinesedis]